MHIVGAGLAGLACAVRLAGSGVAVTLYEAAGQAGGRCRSYHDPVLDLGIDNGNHLILSGNRSMRAYLSECGAAEELWGPAEAIIPFLDIETGEEWKIRPNAGRLPWWLAIGARRAPDGGIGAHLGDLMRLRRAGTDDTVAGLLSDSPLFRRFWRPIAVSVLNTPADQASAVLLWRTFEESLALGGDACRPLFPLRNLGGTFVNPALDRLRRNRAELNFHNRLRCVERHDGHLILKLAGSDVQLGDDDRLVLALPPGALAKVLPDEAALAEPFLHSPILNAHFRLSETVHLPGGLPFLGITGSRQVEWVFVRENLVSATLSAAARKDHDSTESVAMAIWRELRAVVGQAGAPLPPFRIVTEKRATMAQTPGQCARRPGPRALGGNILLAGDWTDTGLPCTIEGAIRSGQLAAELVLGRN